MTRSRRSTSSTPSIPSSQASSIPWNLGPGGGSPTASSRTRSSSRTPSEALSSRSAQSSTTTTSSAPRTALNSSSELVSSRRSSRSKAAKGLARALAKTAEQIHGEMQYQKPFKTTAAVAYFAQHGWQQPLRPSKKYSFGGFSFEKNGSHKDYLKIQSYAFKAGLNTLKSFLKNPRFNKIIQSNLPEIKAYAKPTLGSNYAPLKSAYFKVKATLTGDVPQHRPRRLAMPSTSSVSSGHSGSWSDYPETMSDGQTGTSMSSLRSSQERLSQAASSVTPPSSRASSYATAFDPTPLQDWGGSIDTWREQAAAASYDWMNSFDVDQSRRTRMFPWDDDRNTI
jgi:hypothetical protein